MSDVVDGSPFVSLLVRLFECSLHFRHVNDDNVTNKSCPGCVLRPGEPEWLRFRYKLEAMLLVCARPAKEGVWRRWNYFIFIFICYKCPWAPVPVRIEEQRGGET